MMKEIEAAVDPEPAFQQLRGWFSWGMFGVGGHCVGMVATELGGKASKGCFLKGNNYYCVTWDRNRQTISNVMRKSQAMLWYHASGTAMVLSSAMKVGWGAPSWSWRASRAAPPPHRPAFKAHRALSQCLRGLFFFEPSSLCVSSKKR